MRGKTILIMMMIVLFSAMVVECTNGVPEEKIGDEQTANDTTSRPIACDTIWCVTVINENGGANLRKDPSKEGELIRELHIGDTLKLLNLNDTVKTKEKNGKEQFPQWIKVSLLAGDIKGFLHSNYIDIEKKWKSLNCKGIIVSQEDNNKQLTYTINKADEDYAMHYILYQEKLVGVMVIKDTTFAKFTNDSLSASNIAKLNSAMEKQLREKKQIEQTSQSHLLLYLIGFLGLLLGIIITYVVIKFDVKAVCRKSKGKSESQNVVLEAKEPSQEDLKDQFMKQLIITK